MFLSFARITRFALQQFHRNLWLSIATITLLVLALLTVNLVVSLGAVAQAATAAVQDKIDVSVYFKPQVDNAKAAEVRAALINMPEVKNVEYISKETALERFRGRHQDDAVIIESLSELGDNPFGAALAVKAQNPEQYPQILSFLEAPEYAELIEEKNFADHRLVIERINALIKNVRAFGMGVAAVFGVIAILVVINTVRVAVYTHRGEIRIMRLVGASNWFIRGPFLLEALVFSFVATVLTAAVVYSGLYFIQPYFDRLFGDVRLSLIGYYNVNAITIFGAQLAGIFLLTAISSFFAVRRYLRV